MYADKLPSWLNWLPEVLFSLPYGLAVMYVTDIWYLGAAALIWSYLWMQSATAPALHWGNGGYNPDRESLLKPFVDWLNSKTLHADPSTEAYCWLYMGVKGFLIGLPTGGLVQAILWPSGYEIGDRLHDAGIVTPDPDAFREFMAGVGAGVQVLVFLFLCA